MIKYRNRPFCDKSINKPDAITNIGRCLEKKITPNFKIIKNLICLI